MDELKPCPFCGSKPKMLADFPHVQLITVSCENKECKVHPYTVGLNINEATERWNRRPAPENKPLTLERLRKMDGEPQPVYLVSEEYPEGNGWKVCRGITDNGLLDFGDEAWAMQVFDEGNVTAYAHKPEQKERNYEQ